MSGTEILVIVAGLFIGYWVVSKLFLGGSGAEPSANDHRGGAPGAQPPVTSPAWHEVLKVSPDATADEVRQSYKVLMSQYHPDKVATLGDDLKALAESKTKEITSAYRDAMRLHGLDP